jgi:lysophospholipase L1-like esterase
LPVKRLSLLVACLVAVAAAAGLAVPARAHAATTAPLYVALGDSYSAGLGADNDPSQATPLTNAYDTASGACQRAYASYPYLLAAARGYTLRDVACSGADGRHILSTSLDGEPPQIQAVTPDAALVTLTVGGNDIGFGDIINCVLNTDCTAGSPAITAAYDAIATIVPSRMADVLTAIRQNAPNALIVVGGYAALFPASGDPGTCGAYLTADEMPLMSDVGAQLNAALRAAAAAAGPGVRYVDPTVAGSPFTATSATGQTTDACSTWEQRAINGMVTTGSFHPNRIGQQDYSTLVSAQVPVSTTLTITAPAGITAGTPTALTAAIAPAPDGGTVAFTDGGTTLPGCAAVAVTGGQATCSGPLTAGSHALTATYAGDTGYAPSSGSTTLTVAAPKPATTTATTVSATTAAVVGTPVTLTATVAPGPDGGTVAFTEGGTTLAGCGAVALSGGKAGCAVTFTTAGSHTVTATYSGTGAFARSSGQISGTVAARTPTATTTALGTSAGATAGAPTTLTATLSPAPDGGTVAFTDGGVTLTGCGAVPVGAGKATCTATMAAGSHTLKAAYAGTANYAPSAGTITVTLAAAPTKTATTTTVTAAFAPKVRQTVPLTAAVGPVPDGGTVAFTDGSTPIAGCSAVPVAGGKATCSTAFTTAGTHTVTATYSGTARFAGSVGRLTGTVAAG